MGEPRKEVAIFVYFYEIVLSDILDYCTTRILSEQSINNYTIVINVAYRMETEDPINPPMHYHTHTYIHTRMHGRTHSLITYPWKWYKNYLMFCPVCDKKDILWILN